MTSKYIKIIDVIDRILSELTIIFFGVIICCCGYAIYDAICIHQETRIIVGASRLIENVPDNERILKLKETNPEVIAWLSISGTDIDYPITQTSDNKYYLTHDYKKDYSIAGSIFADYRSNLLEDDYVVIYGHNMSGASMFGAINNFSDEKYLNQHTEGQIYLEDGSVHNLRVLAYAVVNNDSDYLHKLDENAKGENSRVLDYVGGLAHKELSDANFNKLLLLSTCYQHSAQRAVLLVGYNEV